MFQVQNVSEENKLLAVEFKNAGKFCWFLVMEMHVIHDMYVYDDMYVYTLPCISNIYLTIITSLSLLTKYPDSYSFYFIIHVISYFWLTNLILYDSSTLTYL